MQSKRVWSKKRDLVFEEAFANSFLNKLNESVPSLGFNGPFRVPLVSNTALTLNLKAELLSLISQTHTHIPRTKERNVSQKTSAVQFL